MLKFPLLKNDLRTLITLLAMASIIITLGNSLYATWRVQREVLINSTLEYNRVYAAKLASATEIFFQQAQGQLAYSAAVLAKVNDEESPALQEEVDRLRKQTSNFNSVVYVDAGGWVKAVSPESLKLKGQYLTSQATQQALAARRPLISGPLISAIGNLIVFVSYPVKNKSGQYLGFVGGTIYLTKNSILNKLLGEQFYRDGTSLYVTDADNRLLFHPDSKLIEKWFQPLINAEEKKSMTTALLRSKWRIVKPWWPAMPQCPPLTGR
ncbi:MAG: hypothetical protein XXXJIFNMEKO3_02001 [Candidatus Erwinia impunctatus]|nr:hypothetical protein XXXJIFNMEKO_02001 [Culicoides impunctatus]